MYYRDRETGISYQAPLGHGCLIGRDFEEVAKLKNIQGLWIRFFVNRSTGEVGLRMDYTLGSDRVFQNREDGNKWFERYIKPYHGCAFVRC